MGIEEFGQLKLALAVTGSMILALSPGAASARTTCIEMFPLVLADGWTSEFREEFERTKTAYVVRASDRGESIGWPVPCDYRVGPPPPPANRSRKARDEYRAAEKAAEALDSACEPTRLRFTVTEVIKGPPRASWIEEKALFDLRPGAPSEPFYAGPPAAYARHIGIRHYVECMVRARRISSEADYLIFGWPNSSPSPEDPADFMIWRVYLADGTTPFLAEARRLAAEPK